MDVSVCKMGRNIKCVLLKGAMVCDSIYHRRMSIRGHFPIYL